MHFAHPRIPWLQATITQFTTEKFLKTLRLILVYNGGSIMHVKELS